MLLEEINVQCPYCGESFTTTVDCSAGSQQYTEDCYVCCRPIMFNIEVGTEGNLVNLQTQREND
jgi:hypothetical protein